MNLRLAAIRAMIPDGRGVVDVGTDHGYLPVMLRKDGYSGKLYASDIRPGPLSAARRHAAREEADGIEFLLCDGLEACPPEEVDVIVVAGMGGDTICGILDRAEWCLSPNYLLLLQPMTKAEILRYWLLNNGFAIEEERLVCEGRTLYQIIQARFCGVNRVVPDAWLYTGLPDRAGDRELFRRHMLEQRNRLGRVAEGMQSTARQENDRLPYIRALCAEMDEMMGENT